MRRTIDSHTCCVPQFVHFYSFYIAAYLLLYSLDAVYAILNTVIEREKTA